MFERAMVVAVLLCTIPGSAAAQQIAANPVTALMEASPAAGRTQAMELVDERLRVEIDAQHATTTLRQTYHNRSSQTVEGRYSLKAGGGARLDAFAYWNGEQKIVGEVFPLETARAVYDNVTRRERDPGLLEKTGEGEFRFRVFPISSGENKRVELRYTRWLSRRDGVVTYRGPLARGDADIEVLLRDDRRLREIRSSSHALQIKKLSSGVIRVRAKQRSSQTKPSAFVLSYRVAAPPLQLSGHLHRDPGHDGYFAVTIAAPALRRAKVIDRDVTLVIDRSGSMSGAALANAKRAAAQVVRGLRPSDRVNVIAFDSEAEGLFEAPAEVAQSRKLTIAFIEGLRDGGGTDIASALQHALAAQVDSGRTRVILFLTDGRSAAQRALEVAVADKRDVRVFTIGLGEMVDRALLSRLAALKRGDFTFIASAQEIESRVSALTRRIGAPVMVDLALNVKGAIATRVYPRSLPDLFASDELLITGRIRGTGKATLTLLGKIDGKAVSRTMSVALPKRANRPWVGRLWAQSRIEYLMEEIALNGETKELKDEALELALAYNIVTKYTAFLAIPASELSASSRHRLARARAKKKLIMSRNQDAVALGQPGMAIDPSPSSQNVRFSSGTDVENTYVIDDNDVHRGTPGPEQVKSKGSSCAGCRGGASGGSGAGLILLLVAVALCSRKARNQVR